MGQENRTNDRTTSEDDKGIKKALIIGVSKYQDKRLKDLKFCKQDADEMYSFLTCPKVGFQVSKLNRKVNRTKDLNMKIAMRDFFKDPNIKSQDTLLFYFAGHGVMDMSGEVFLASSETDSRDPIIGGVPFRWLTELMNECYSTRIIAILDCCHSGAQKSLRLTGGITGGISGDNGINSCLILVLRRLPRFWRYFHYLYDTGIYLAILIGFNKSSLLSLFLPNLL